MYAVSTAVAVAGVLLGATLTRTDTGDGIARTTAKAYERLPAAQRDRTVIVGESYIVAAYIDGYATKYDLPQAFSPTRSYGYFPAPDAGLDTVLLVGDNEPARLRPHFTDVKELEGAEDEIGVWLLTGPTEDWDTLWPNVRALAVI